MAIVKFITSSCPMNNIFPYITRPEATDRDLIDGVNCAPESAHDEFLFVKERFGKEDGRQYYHVIQSFAPEENVTPELAHEIGMELAMYFGGYQAVVSTHINEAHIHNHIVFNSVNFENGKKFHQSRDDMLKVKEYSNKLCRERGLSVTEEKCTCGRYPKWKKRLCAFLDWALECSPTPEAFIECMERHGYSVKWYSDYKYMTFTTPEGYTCRDNKLFDERFLKSNIELYFAMGGCNGALAETYQSYKTPEHDADMNMTVTTGLIRMIGDVLSVAPPRESHTPRQLTEMDWEEKERLEQILGRKISPQAFVCYCTKEEYEQANGLGYGMYM